MRSQAPEPGTVIQIALPDGRYAYGRVLRDASVAFYRQGLTALGARQ
ncbi:Imm26 family immunity protein [Isoptericola sp. NPDC057191]